MSTLKKTLVISREVANRLRIRFGQSPSLLVREGFDSSGNPTVNIDDGTPAAGEQAVFMRTIENPSIGTNAVGIAQDSFGPNTSQIVLEATAADAANSLLRDVHKLRLMGEVLRMGTKVEVYLVANGVAPSVSGILPANLVGTFQDLYFPLLNDS